MQAATIGMRKRMAVSTRACGICSGELRDFGAVVSASEEVRGEPIVVPVEIVRGEVVGDLIRAEK